MEFMGKKILKVSRKLLVEGEKGKVFKKAIERMNIIKVHYIQVW
jgi:hypothetical protein